MQFGYNQRIPPRFVTGSWCAVWALALPACGQKPPMRLEITAGNYALSSEGILHPLTAEMLGQRNDRFSLLNKLSDTVEVLKSKFYVGASGQVRHPLTSSAVPKPRGRYVS